MVLYSELRLKLIRISSSIDPPYPVQGGLFHKEAIMLLRRFYIQENEKGMWRTSVTVMKSLLTKSLTAPKPRPKKHRELKTDFEKEVSLTSSKH